MTLYTTGSTGYGAGASAVTSTTSNPDGTFQFTLPTSGTVCPSGSFAYVVAAGGNSGSGTNPNLVLMTVIGLCDSNYSGNTYSGPTLMVNEITTAISTYALANFMTVSGTGSAVAVNIGAPANNIGTFSSTSKQFSATVSAANGLPHAMANALAMMNINIGMPYSYTGNAATASAGAVIPEAEVYLVANVLAACVNSQGVTGSNSATSNDGTNCGKLFSFVTPPQANATVPSNTLQAMLDLAKYPNPGLNTWNSGCTAAGSGSVTATSCIFGLASSQPPFSNALGSAPPDWTLALVYTSGYGANTTSTNCATAGTCPGLAYPFAVALDYQDDVYVLNWDSNSGSTSILAAGSWTNLLGFTNNGSSLFTTPKDTSNKSIRMIATDTAGDVLAPVTSANAVNVYTYNATNGVTGPLVVTNASPSISAPQAIAVDPFNNAYTGSNTAGVNIRKLAYASGPTYTVSSYTTTAPNYAVQQIAFNSLLDLYTAQAASTNPNVSVIPNSHNNATAAPVGNNPATTTVSGVSANTFGIVPATTTTSTSTASSSPFTATAYVLSTNGLTALATNRNGNSSTLTASSTSTAIPAVNGTLNSRFAFADGSGWVYSPDNAAGGAASGVSVYDSTDNLALGTYKGCYVISSACTTGPAAPMYSPRDMAIDSSGDIWVVSGSSANLTELIGAAAPTWPALSLALTGKPQ